MITDSKYRIKKTNKGYVPPESYSVKQISTSEFAGQVKKFLLENFEAAYDAEDRCEGFRYMYISPEGFAYFVRTVLKEIYGNELLLIKISTEYDKLYFDLKFKTERLSPEGREILAEVAAKSGFSYEIREELIRVLIKTRAPDALELRAGKEELIYNALMDVFFGYKSSDFAQQFQI